MSVVHESRSILKSVPKSNNQTPIHFILSTEDSDLASLVEENREVLQFLVKANRFDIQRSPVEVRVRRALSINQPTLNYND